MRRNSPRLPKSHIFDQSFPQLSDQAHHKAKNFLDIVQEYSPALAVNPVAAATLAFTTQPGSAPAGSILPGPPTVAVQDAFGNNSVASGYTLAASTTGLMGATSGAFNIIAAGGTITGTITRLSDGTPVAVAVVEAFQGTVLHGAASTNASESLRYAQQPADSCRR